MGKSRGFAEEYRGRERVVVLQSRCVTLPVRLLKIHTKGIIARVYEAAGVHGQDLQRKVLDKGSH